MNELRLLDPSELVLVSGGLSLTPDATQCPADEWWNPNWLTDDAGYIQKAPAQNGPIDGYWTDGSTWCLYDTDNNLLGIYKEDPNGSLTMTFSSESTFQHTMGDGTTTYNTATGGGYTVTLSRVQR